MAKPPVKRSSRTRRNDPESLAKKVSAALNKPLGTSPEPVKPYPLQQEIWIVEDKNGVTRVYGRLPSKPLRSRFNRNLSKKVR